MSTISRPTRAHAFAPLASSENGASLLRTGDNMKQPEFHRRYEAYAEDARFELVGGVVYMASPLGLTHSRYDDEVGFALGLYRRTTPGVEVLHSATAILDEESEPQPDLGLRILPEYGGRSRTTDDYIDGPPELLVEIACSTRAIDMNQKRQDYDRTGVQEYLVLCVEERELHWFDFASGGVIRPDRRGVARSRVFPGLWIDAPALLERNSPRLIAAVQEGLASRAHAAFVKRLEKARKRRS
jgi:Uma2 family endonuclease